MTLKEFAKTYFPNDFVVEVFDKVQAQKDLASKTSCCWGNGVVGTTGWVVLAQPSAQHAGNTRTVFVCRAELILYKTVALPIEVPDGDYCYETTPFCCCRYFDNEGGHPTCRLNIADLEYNPSNIRGQLKPDACRTLKTCKNNI